MHKFASCHDIASIAVKPTATSDMEKNFLTTNGEVMKYAFTGKAIGTQIRSRIGSLFIFVQVNMNSYLTVFIGKTDIL